MGEKRPVLAVLLRWLRRSGLMSEARKRSSFPLRRVYRPVVAGCVDFAIAASA
jgi:hypothetical protein